MLKSENNQDKMSLRKLIKFKGRQLWFWLILLASGCLFPNHSARAFLAVLTAPLVALAQIATIFLIAVPLSWGFLKLGQIILDWASSPDLIGGITHNAFVVEGWTVIRDFSNMFFILILVVIGIATALRIKQYEVKKTLPKLIGVALLINFSPVICGVVIDAANILTNFFLSAGAAGFDQGLNLAQSSGAYMTGSVRSALGNWSEIWRGILFFKLLIITIFNFFGAFVLMLFAMLFLVRNLALWILVILSPLAFLSIVFPVTKKKAFDKWLEQFMQWTFIGVGGAFFLYLAQLMLHIGLKGPGAVISGGGPATEASEFGGKVITNLIVMATPFVFLIIGYIVTISTSNKAAGAIIAFAKKGAGYINPLTKKGRGNLNKLKKGTAGLALKGAGKIPGVKKLSKQVIGKKPEKWKETRGIKKLGRAVLPYWAREQMAAAIVKPEEGKIEKINKAKKETDKLETPTALRSNMKEAKRKGNVAKQIAIMQTAAEKGLIDEFSGGEITDAIQKANKINKKLAKEIMQSAPNVAQALYKASKNDLKKFEWLAKDAGANNKPKDENKWRKKIAQKQTEMENAGLWLDKEDEERYGSLEAKIVSTMKTKDIGRISKNYITNKNNDPNNKFMEIVQDIKHQGRNSWSGNKLAKLSDEFGTPAVERYNKITDELGEEGFERNNAKKWITSSPGSYAAGYRRPGEKEGKVSQPQPQPQPTSGPGPTGPGPGPGPGSRHKKQRPGTQDPGAYKP